MTHTAVASQLAQAHPNPWHPLRNPTPTPSIPFLPDLPGPRDLCGKTVLIRLNPDTGQMTLVRLFCGRWDCPQCAARRRAKITAQAYAGRPERIIVLTMIPNPSIGLPGQIRYIRDRLRVLLQRIKRTFGPFAYMSVLELQKNGTPHLHLLQRGTYIPQRWLSQVWHSLTGAHRVWIQKVDKKAGAIAEVTKYLLKTAGQVQALCPNIPLVTKSKDWLPEDWHADEETRDPYAGFVRFAVSWHDALALIARLGGSTEPEHANPYRRIIHLPRPPPPEVLARLIEEPDNQLQELAALLLWTAFPDLSTHHSLPDLLAHMGRHYEASLYYNQVRDYEDPPVAANPTPTTTTQEPTACPTKRPNPVQSSLI